MFYGQEMQKKNCGYFVGRRGYLEKEEDSDDTKKMERTVMETVMVMVVAPMVTVAVMVAVMVVATVVEE